MKLNDYFPLSWSDFFGITGFSSIIFNLLEKSTNNGLMAAILAVVTFVVIIFILSISRLWRKRENCFNVLDDKERTHTYDFIKQCAECIYVTHFTESTPSTQNLYLMKEKMEQGVSAPSEAWRFLPGESPGRGGIMEGLS
jgi:hypothetical protein